MSKQHLHTLMSCKGNSKK